MIIAPLMLATNDKVSSDIKEALLAFVRNFPAVTFKVMKPLCLMDSFIDFVKKSIAIEARSHVEVPMPVIHKLDLRAGQPSDNLIFSLQDALDYPNPGFCGDDAAIDKRLRL